MKRENIAVTYEFGKVTSGLSDSEFGRLIRSWLAYSQEGIMPKLEGTERIFADLVRKTEDTDREHFEAVLKQKREAGRKSAECRSTALNAVEKVSAKRKEPKENTHDIYINNNNNNTSPKTVKHYKQYGKYNWIKLTDEQYAKLLNDLGEALLTDTITKLDEYCQQNGNKGKYKDFNLVIRKAVREHWFERTGSTKRPNSKEFDERDVHESEFANGFYADVMNRKRPGEGA